MVVMRTNGYLYILEVTGGGIDLNGEPISTTEEWSDAIPCNIATNQDSQKGKYENGVFRQASFTILTDIVISGVVKRVKLERFDEDLGEYDIMSVVKVPGMGRTKIVV